MEPKCSLPCTQQPATYPSIPKTTRVQSTTPILFLRTDFLNSLPSSSTPKSPWHFKQPNNSMYTYFFTHTCATLSTVPPTLSSSPDQCFVRSIDHEGPHYPIITGFLIGPTIPLNALFHSTMRSFCFLSVTDKVSPTYVQNLCDNSLKGGGGRRIQ